MPMATTGMLEAFSLTKSAIVSFPTAPARDEAQIMTSSILFPDARSYIAFLRYSLPFLKSMRPPGNTNRASSEEEEKALFIAFHILIPAP